MDNRLLVWVCLVCSLCGLTVLFYFTQEATGMAVNIGELTRDQKGMVVKACGTLVKHYVSRKGHVFMRIEDRTGGIDIVVFSSNVHKISGYDPIQLKTGDWACFRGPIEVYRGRLEIIPGWIGQYADD